MLHIGMPHETCFKQVETKSSLTDEMIEQRKMKEIIAVFKCFWEMTDPDRPARSLNERAAELRMEKQMKERTRHD